MAKQPSNRKDALERGQRASSATPTDLEPKAALDIASARPNDAPGSRSKPVVAVMKLRTDTNREGT